MKRVFAAINLPDGIKKDLGKALDKVRPLFGSEVRFLSPNNWHLTIEFLAYQDDNSIALVSEALQETASKFAPPVVHLEKMVYGPPDKTPRMIWLTASEETSAALGKIKDFLEKELFALGVRFRQESRLFKSRLTLARFEAVSKKELPPLDLPFVREFEAESIDLMESHLKRSGAEYDLLSKFDFGGE